MSIYIHTDSAPTKYSHITYGSGTEAYGCFEIEQRGEYLGIFFSDTDSIQLAIDNLTTMRDLLAIRRRPKGE